MGREWRENRTNLQVTRTGRSKEGTEGRSYTLQVTREWSRHGRELTSLHERQRRSKQKEGQTGYRSLTAKRSQEERLRRVPQLTGHQGSQGTGH